MAIFETEVGLQRCVLCKERSIDAMVLVRKWKRERIARGWYKETVDHKCICRQCVEAMAETLGLAVGENC